MPHSTSPLDAVPARETPGVPRLLFAAVRLAGALPATRSTLGVVRGRHQSDRQRAGALRARLAERGVHSTELSPLPEPGERGGTYGLPVRGVGLLLHTPGVRPEQAMRAAALWRLPLLTERPEGAAGGEPGALGGRRSAVIGIHLADRGYELALHRVGLVSLRPDPGPARLILDNEKITMPGGRPLCVTVTGSGLLEVRGDSFGMRRVRRLRFERAAGGHRLDLDGTPVREVRAPLRMAAEPGRLHLLYP
ncbi:hypothetical protein ACSP97_17415 [Streptomyces sp. SCPE 10]|uniref:hypothetical protein n=1 Tax=Streptomyces sp. SCPE 10 TaxID=3449273 RepID=UPI003F81C6B9